MPVPRTCNCTNFNWEPKGEPTEFGKLIKEAQNVSFKIMRTKYRQERLFDDERKAQLQAEIDELLVYQKLVREQLQNLK